MTHINYLGRFLAGRKLETQHQENLKTHACLKNLETSLEISYKLYIVEWFWQKLNFLSSLSVDLYQTMSVLSMKC